VPPASSWRTSAGSAPSSAARVRFSNSADPVRYTVLYDTPAGTFKARTGTNSQRYVQLPVPYFPPEAFNRRLVLTPALRGGTVRIAGLSIGYETCVEPEPDEPWRP